MTIPHTPDNLDALSEQAFEAHAAMLRTERDDPKLSANPYWQALRDSANARFQIAYAAAAKQ